ncbi:kinase [Amnibacterium setariae]|uniref:Kinase n=1 Tax=Amnibacterium setariae TaxID=2306585 RepID=A0A3A1U1L2_9MICO|nr:AAA family ATPase [Amnibacterium setariae]RIX30401.1 kinase [Amnibacterium setariae]
MLVVLRGGAGSGESTAAAALQRELGRPAAVLGQDHFRRVVFNERTGESHPDGMEHAALLELAAEHLLAAGRHVVIEGILAASRYAAMLERLAGAADDARFLADDLTLEETVRRHATRPQPAHFGADELREWYRGWDPLPFVAEQRIGPEASVQDVVDRVLGGRPSTG